MQVPQPYHPLVILLQMVSMGSRLWFPYDVQVTWMQGHDEAPLGTGVRTQRTDDKTQGNTVTSEMDKG